jgi:hypothetical protein
MNEKIKKILGVSILAIGMVLVKTCVKTADHVVPAIVKGIENVTPGIVKGAEHVAPRGAIIIARQYLKNDNFLRGNNIDTWTENEYRDYFLSNLGKISVQIDTLKSIDTTNSKKVKLYYHWIRNYCVEKNVNNELNEIIKKTKDSTNQELKAGSAYFCRLVYADFFINNDDFKDDFMNDKFVKRFNMLEKKIIVKHQNKFTEILSKHFYKKFFPFHKDIADKIITELVTPKKHSTSNTNNKTK